MLQQCDTVFIPRFLHLYPVLVVGSAAHLGTLMQLLTALAHLPLDWGCGGLGAGFASKMLSAGCVTIALGAFSEDVRKSLAIFTSATLLLSVRDYAVITTTESYIVK